MALGGLGGIGDRLAAAPSTIGPILVSRAARTVLGQFRGAAGQRPDDPRFAEIVAALSEASTGNSGSGGPTTRSGPSGPPRSVSRHPEAGLITLELFQLRLAEHPGLLMVMQTPASPDNLVRVTALLGVLACGSCPFCHGRCAPTRSGARRATRCTRTPRCSASWPSALAPPEPQLQHAALRLTARGLGDAAAARARRLGRARRRARPAPPRGGRRAQRRPAPNGSR